MHYIATDMFEGEPPSKWSNFCCSPACEETVKPATRIKGVTGVILAGGGSSRMGSNKSLLLHKGSRLIEVIYRALAELFEEVLIVTNTPELYRFLPCRKVPDIYSGQGVMAGIHAGLSRSSEAAVFVVACDMPHLSGALIRHLTTLTDGVDVVMPVTVGGFEPLHAIYRKECLPVLEELLQNTENRRVVALLSRVRVRKVIPEEIAPFDPEFTSFDNINTPEEYSKLRKSNEC
ncbi:MAG: molybdenum cofactor guanylyltransferase [Desulfuromonadaceae bacterium]|nr:molybdenum cofactor guanylyltransferase [Desulfuromonadaceae bacterium]